MLLEEVERLNSFGEDYNAIFSIGSIPIESMALFVSNEIKKRLVFGEGVFCLFALSTCFSSFSCAEMSFRISGSGWSSCRLILLLIVLMQAAGLENSDFSRRVLKKLSGGLVPIHCHQFSD